MAGITTLLRRLLRGKAVPEEEPEDPVVRCQAVLAERPRDPQAHFELGSLYYVRGRLDEAARELEEAVALRSDFADAHYMLGLVYARQGLREKAARAFERTLKTSTNKMMREYAQNKLQALSEA
ncbi:MAG TPA: tetratricopeptide repeat protein [Anaerolineae bacterium]|nr:tetratricopeptide repeat protein [Anaerolineae bacterium]